MTMTATVRHVASLIRLAKAARDRGDFATVLILEGRIAAALR